MASIYLEHWSFTPSLVFYTCPNYIGEGNVSMQPVWQYMIKFTGKCAQRWRLWFLVMSLSALHLQARILMSNYSALLPCLLGGPFLYRSCIYEGTYTWNKTRFISMMTHTYSSHQGFPYPISLQTWVMILLLLSRSKLSYWLFFH